MNKPGTPTSNPTELEAAALGALWQNGPCTAYALRQHFLQSPSPRWSGSAGAIYPLIRRLEEKGLVNSKSAARGERSQRDYTITRTGTATLRKWVLQTAPEPAVELLHDPLRTKTFFLDVLTSEQAKRFAASVLQELQDRVGAIRQSVEDSPLNECPSAYFAARNALLLAEARLKWIKELADHTTSG